MGCASLKKNFYFFVFCEIVHASFFWLLELYALTTLVVHEYSTYNNKCCSCRVRCYVCSLL
jgi:hypothetical protein